MDGNRLKRIEHSWVVAQFRRLRPMMLGDGASDTIPANIIIDLV